MVSILVTAGPTREYIDDVRFLANGSSGRMGCALATEALASGHRVAVILGPVEVDPPSGAAVDRVVSALEMQAAAERRFPSCDVLIAAAAVADYRPRTRSPGKPPRAGPMTLELVPNPDIVAGLAARKGPRVVVGFALETVAADMESAVARARDKLARKGLDLVVCNRTDALGADAGEAVLLWADGRREDIGRQEKARIARRVIEAAVQLFGQRNPE
jgi:phosphopantothenoylcysteine decarboxylase/phosphopantothenate--cysteine ligase